MFRPILGNELLGRKTVTFFLSSRTAVGQTVQMLLLMMSIWSLKASSNCPYLGGILIIRLMK